MCLDTNVFETQIDNYYGLIYRQRMIYRIVNNKVACRQLVAIINKPV